MRALIRWPTLAAVLVALVASACAAGSPSRSVTRAAGAVRASSPASVPPRITTPAHVELTVTGSGPGTRLDAGFLGLGLEANTLALNEFAHTDLADFMRRLDARGLLRIGGNSVESFWTSTGEPAPRWSHGRITPTDLRQLAKVIDTTGWRVILGVAFKHSTPARAADEARYAKAILGARLAAVEIGNEPDLYRISEAAYFPRFERFAHAIQHAVPSVPIAGPATSRVGESWLPVFVHDETPHPDVSLLTAHEYPLTRCEGPTPTIAELLSTTSAAHEVTAARDAVRAGRALGVPALIDETNSVVCWGQPGVSNTFASALWILDYGLLLAQNGISAANFQTRISGCKPYLPVCTLPHSTQLYARPEFYGLLALEQVGTGRFLDVHDPASASLRAFAVQNSPTRLSLVLDNLGTATTVSVRLPPGHPADADETVLATGSSRGLTATSQVTFAGRTVGPGARLKPPVTAGLAITGSTLTVHVGAHSAAVIALS